MQTIRLCNAFIKPNTTWFIFMFLNHVKVYSFSYLSFFFSISSPPSHYYVGIKILKCSNWRALNMILGNALALQLYHYQLYCYSLLRWMNCTLQTTKDNVDLFIVHFSILTLMVNFMAWLAKCIQLVIGYIAQRIKQNVSIQKW